MFYIVTGHVGSYDDAAYSNEALYEDKALANAHAEFLNKKYERNYFSVEEIEVSYSFAEPQNVLYSKYLVMLNPKSSKFSIKKETHIRYGDDELPCNSVFSNKTIFSNSFQMLLLGKNIESDFCVESTEWVKDDEAVEPTPDLNLLADAEEFVNRGNYFYELRGSPNNGAVLNSRVHSIGCSNKIDLVTNVEYEALKLGGRTPSCFKFKITQIKSKSRISNKNRVVTNYRYTFSNPQADVFNSSTAGFLIREI